MNSPDQSTPRFGLWIRSIFDDDVPDPPRPMEASERVEFIKQLFDAFESLMSHYSVDAVARGLERLIDPGGNDDMHALKDDHVPVEKRVAAIASLSGLLGYFEAHCLPVLSHNSERPRSNLNEICYCWWDIFPVFPMLENPKRRPIEAAFLRHMSDALKSASPAVQEYGLHGFSHWSHDYPKEAKEAIDDYLRHHPIIDESLRAYATDARAGLVP